jgi:hypothetical protein
VQEKSWSRFGQGAAAALSMAKSAERAKPKAVQHSAKQLLQSGRRLSLSIADVEPEVFFVMSMGSLQS